MKQKTIKLLIGVIIIIVGLNLILHAANVKFNLFFEGWWTIPIMVVAIASILNEGIQLGNFGLLLVSLWLLAKQRDWIPTWFHSKYIAGGMIVIFGLLFIFSSRKNETTNSETASRTTESSRRFNFFTTAKEDTTPNPSYTAIFSGQDIRNSTEKLDGSTLFAFFGGLSADFRNAVIDHDIIIEATSIFGGINFRFPSTVHVVTKATLLFGGIDNKAQEPEDRNSPTVTVRCFTIFGGIDIK